MSRVTFKIFKRPAQLTKFSRTRRNLDPDNLAAEEKKIFFVFRSVFWHEKVKIVFQCQRHTRDQKRGNSRDGLFKDLVSKSQTFTAGNADFKFTGVTQRCKQLTFLYKLQELDVFLSYRVPISLNIVIKLEVTVGSDRGC